MKKILATLLFSLALSVPVSKIEAFNPIKIEPERPYALVDIEYEGIATEVLGTLNDYPEMIEFTVSTESTLKLSLSQRASESILPLQILVVRQDTRANLVTEVTRSNYEDSDWMKVPDYRAGISLLKSKEVETSLEPGNYRIEVSSPSNQGSYLLSISGTEGDSSYSGTVSGIRLIQQHFDYSFLRLFFSPYVYIPFLLLGLLIVGRRSYKKYISHAG